MLLAAILSAVSWVAFLLTMYLFAEESEQLERALARGRGERVAMVHARVNAIRVASTIYVVASALAGLNTVIALLFPDGNWAAAVFVVCFNVVAHALLFVSAERCRFGLSCDEDTEQWKDHAFGGSYKGYFR